MFKERIIVTLKKVGFGVGMLLSALAFLALLFWFCSLLSSKTAETIFNIFVGVFASLLGLIIAIGIIGYICNYLNWQFIQPYKDWKNRRRENDGKCN